jgi:hypothetical protein
VWLCDRYERGEMGLARPLSTQAEEVRCRRRLNTDPQWKGVKFRPALTGTGWTRVVGTLCQTVVTKDRYLPADEAGSSLVGIRRNSSARFVDPGRILGIRGYAAMRRVKLRERG